MLRTGSRASIATARSSSSSSSSSSRSSSSSSDNDNVVKHYHRGGGDNQNIGEIQPSPSSSHPQQSPSHRFPRKSTGRGGKRHFDRGGPGSWRDTTSYSRASEFYGGVDDLDMLLHSTRDLCSLIEVERYTLNPRFFAQFQVATHRVLNSARSIADFIRRQTLTTFAPPSHSTPYYDNYYSHRVYAPPLPEGPTNHNISGNYHQQQNVESQSQSQSEESPQTSAETILKKAKVMIPENPDYNFIGRILGPRGISVRQLEAATGCGILIRGRGSVKDPMHEETLRARNAPGFEHLYEPLHVLITSEGYSDVECDAKIEKCKRRIKKLLKPEYDEYKRRQLAQLAMINGSYDPTRSTRRMSSNNA